MTKVEVFAPAKINLALHITGQRDDGYHELDTLVAFADVGDRLTLSPSDASALKVGGPEADGVPGDFENLALQAAALIGVEQEVSITLTKNLPVSSGIGGGSADAAAAVRGKLVIGAGTAAGMPDIAIEAHTSALAALGADIPMCLASSTLRAEGVGDRLTRVKLPKLHAVLVNPRVPVSTPDVFKVLKSHESPPLNWPPAAGSSQELCAWLRAARNDLEAPAMGTCPVISDMLKALSQQAGVMLIRMSGSGATCFGIFPDQGLAEIAAKAIETAEPSWWVRDCELGDMSDLAEPHVA